MVTTRCCGWDILTPVFQRYPIPYVVVWGSGGGSYLPHVLPNPPHLPLNVSPSPPHLPPEYRVSTASGEECDSVGRHVENRGNSVGEETWRKMYSIHPSSHLPSRKLLSLLELHNSMYSNQLSHYVRRYYRKSPLVRVTNVRDMLTSLFYSYLGMNKKEYVSYTALVTWYTMVAIHVRMYVYV